MMNLDELFEILDCYVDDPVTRDWLDYGKPKIWYTDNTAPLKTNGIEFNKNSISCSTSNKMDRKYDGNATTIAGIDSLQLTTSH